MTTLENFVSPALTRALGWTLLHSLWQGALVAAVLAGALLLLRRQRAEVRYVAAAGALGMVVALAGITFGLYFNSGLEAGRGLLPGRNVTAEPALLPEQAEGPAVAAAVAPAAQAAAVAGVAEAKRQLQPKPAAPAKAVVTPAAQAGAPSWLAAGLRYFDSHLPLLVVAWLLGLLAMSLRMLGGLLYVQRLRRYRVRPLPAAWQERLAALAARSGVRRPVALLESALVRVPLVVGHIRPVILLPLGTVAGLSPAYLEAILAHELAHVLRRDYLVNLLQTVAEVLFFYHPAVWFLANCVRTERENCCDDTATALVGGDPLRLARALTALAEWSQSAVVLAAPRLALAAIGGRGALLNRVRRLVQRRPAAPTLAEGVMAGALVLGGLALLGSSVALAGPLAQAARPAARGLSRASTAAGFGLSQAKPQPAGTALPAQAADTVRDLPLRPDDHARANPNGAASDTLPKAATARRGRRQTEPGTVVVTKDKKGRLVALEVNGEPVPVPTAKPSKAERRAGQQVTVLPVPPAAPGRRNSSFDYDPRRLDRAGQEADQAGRALDKASRELDQAARRLDRKADAYTHNESRREGRNRSDIHVDIDEGALNELVTNALKLGNASLNIGLQAASQGLDEARRSLETTLRDPSLGAEARRATRQALAELRQEQGQARREKTDRAQEALDRAQEARDRAQETRDQQQEARDRRQELQDRIREAQQALRDLDRERGSGDDRNDALTAEMQKDGLLKDPNHYQVKLTARQLVIDGREQPQPVHQKYVRLYESTGRKLSGTSALVLTRNSDSSTIIDNDPPAPPRPPRAPRAPRSGPGALAPLPPAAPLTAPPGPARAAPRRQRNPAR